MRDKLAVILALLALLLAAALPVVAHHAFGGRCCTARSKSLTSLCQS